MTIMITLPSKPKIIEQKDNRAVFEIGACYPGYGMTLGNALRRVLLSSLPGAAITGVKIKGVQHEFSTIPHVAEDVVQIILNLKQIRFKLHVDHQVDRIFKLELKVKGEKKVTAGDIKTSPELEVVNKDAHIATLTDKKGELYMDIEVRPGLGYSSIESRKEQKLEVGKIAIDAIFSPVQRANYNIELMRVGDRTDYDRLVFTVETDGTLTPKEAFLKSANILVDHYKIFTELDKEAKAKKKSKTKKAVKKTAPKSKDKKIDDDLSKTKVEELKISARTSKALDQAGIKSVAGIIRKTDDDLKKLEGLGDKGVVEIKRAIGKLGLTLKS